MNGRSSGFADFHLSRDVAEGPRTRLDTPWSEVGVHDGWILRIAARDGDGLVGSSEVGVWSAWSLGEILSYRDDAERPLERFVLDLDRGASEPAALNGSFLVVARHGRSGEWHIWNDRLGTVPVYAAAGDDSVITSYFQAAGRGRLDRLGLSGFARFGFFPSDRTWLDHVRAVRPATHVTVDPRDGAAKDETYWEWSYEPDTDRSPDGLLEDLDAVLSAVVDDHARRGRLVIPLSGGLDSRTLFAVATRDHPGRVAALAYGYRSDSLEVRIPRALAARRGAPLRELVVPPYLIERIDTVLDAVEGFGGLSFTRQVGALGDLQSLGDRIVGGHWGDVWFDGFGASGLVDEALVDQALALVIRPGGAHLDGLLLPPLPDAPTELRSLVARELARLPDLGDADMTIKAFKTEQWSARWTIPGTCAYRAALPLALPFYDNRLTDFFLTVPTGALPGRRLQIDYLKRHHGDLASVPWEATRRSLFASPEMVPMHAVRRVVGKAARTLRRSPAPTRNWEVQYGSPTARAELVARLTALPPSVVDHEASVELLAGWQRHPTGATGYEIDMLMTVATMLPRIALQPPRGTR